ncbi:hypothetical protein [Candidatus Bathycorpusculum sp.]|jgi:zinc transporter ZupT|uniref:hypothetical protein n=1 Tax=Candidatus Bathycorpusculum sp. TaxID=2994959 RepID=UPI00282F7429|nr:hypothetical protein [Candidatus Termitimicrobium sp.]MCL2686796.1 hypothetical protein [Candidatus Termitimicrobium sp.]
MASRLKTFVLIFLVGFIGGILALVTSKYIIPWLGEVLPALADIGSFIIAGFAGGVITVVIVFIWAALSGKKDNSY